VISIDDRLTAEVLCFCASASIPDANWRLWVLRATILSLIILLELHARTHKYVLSHAQVGPENI